MHFLASSFLANYLVWLGLAGFLFLFSFAQTNGDNTRVLAGFVAAVGALVFFFT
jgi:hypothetical protein